MKAEHLWQAEEITPAERISRFIAQVQHAQETGLLISVDEFERPLNKLVDLSLEPYINALKLIAVLTSSSTVSEKVRLEAIKNVTDTLLSA